MTDIKIRDSKGNKLSKLNFFYFGVILGVFLVFIKIKLHDFYLDHKISILQEKNKKLDEEINNLTNKN
jgi:hypothetical protein